VPWFLIHRKPIVRDFQVEIAVTEGCLLQALLHCLQASRSHAVLHRPLNEVAALARLRHTT